MEHRLVIYIGLMYDSPKIFLCFSVFQDISRKYFNVQYGIQFQYDINTYCIVIAHPHILCFK